MHSSSAPHLILISGFLGAGKTSLLLTAATRLRTRGKRVCLITNDQGDELVDTRLAEKLGFDTAEIAGGCFCCRFSDFVGAAQKFLDTGVPPDAILCEPVGSCTDLVATILRPLASKYAGRFRMAPLTVVVDPRRATRLLAADADPDLAYLFRKQLAEADLALFSRADLKLPLPRLPGIASRSVSSITGEGVDEWLDDLMNAPEAIRSGNLDIDYGRYAAAEAALGWMNWRGQLRTRCALTPTGLAEQLLAMLDERLSASGVAIVHLKIYLESEGGYLKASVCNNGEILPVVGDLNAGPAQDYHVIVNLRAVADPEVLAKEVSSALVAIGEVVAVDHSEAFRPSAPQPEFRLVGA
jgi:CobW/HypB/UreG, nucleotide-binding domain